jgi:hypothetical protein
MPLRPLTALKAAQGRAAPRPGGRDVCRANAGWQVWIDRRARCYLAVKEHARAKRRLYVLVRNILDPNEWQVNRYGENRHRKAEIRTRVRISAKEGPLRNPAHADHRF